MFYKSSNILKFEVILKKRMYQNNFETQFYIQSIQKENQIRIIISSITVDIRSFFLKLP